MHLVEFHSLSCLGLGEGAHCAAALTWELLEGMKRIVLENLYADITNIFQGIRDGRDTSSFSYFSFR